MSPSAIQKPLSQSVIERVAEAENTDPIDLDAPLYEVIDPDALDSLFSPTGRDRQADGQITFSYCGYTVVVDSSGAVGLADEETSSVETSELFKD